jgi:hypothetical protein
MISAHEIPLAIGLLKGISWISSYQKSGLLLFNYVWSNYKVVNSWKKNPEWIFVNKCSAHVKGYPMQFSWGYMITTVHERPLNTI